MRREHHSDRYDRQREHHAAPTEQEAPKLLQDVASFEKTGDPMLIWRLLQKTY
jgi:hypothetical protein